MGLRDALGRLLGSSNADATAASTAGEPGERDATETVATREHGSGDAGQSPAETAGRLIQAAAEEGYDLDFSPESLVALDELIETVDPGRRAALGRPATAYLGEVFVRHYDCEWTTVENVGQVIDTSRATDGDDEDLFLVPHATQAALEGEVSFAAVHDDTVAGLRRNGPTLADGDRLGGGGPGGSPVDEADANEYAERAEALADDWPEYDLDFSPESLARIDELIADYYDQSPPDVGRAERARESPPGGVPEGASLQIGSGGAAAKIEAYVGEVFRREYDGEWWSGDGPDPVIVVEAGGQQLELELKMLVSAAFPGHVSFERTHEHLAAEIA